MHAFLTNLANRQTNKCGQTHLPFSFVGRNEQTDVYALVNNRFVGKQVANLN